MSQWVTLCPFCHASHTMTHAVERGNFHLVAIPWADPLEIFTITRPLLIILKDPNHYFYAEAVQIYSRLHSAQSAIASLIPVVPTSEDTPEGNIRRFVMLMDSIISDEQYKNRQLFMAPLRLLPKREAFTEETQYWNEACYKHYPISKWERLVSWKLDQQSA